MIPTASARPRPGVGPCLHRLAGFALALLLLLLADPARSDTGAAEFIESVGAEFLAIAGANGETPASRVRRVREFLDNRTELTTIARFTAGRAWRQMSAPQRAEYQAALRDLAAGFLVKRMESTDNPTFRVLRSAALPDQGGILVTTEVSGAGSSDLLVDWRLVERDGQYSIVDVILEGVSLLVTYRSEIAAVLAAERNNIDGLIANLRERGGG